ncbi:hypothetical protein FB45DRAFT_1029261 [Roridomyces roridus]|uniref:Uncharacterized protein n=1 Tax=Roridomyces roridus TaxID=1738132 RepID=A0AAD7BP94_9AGAR|nr:hypothetical protein FB45DRAFT_1029261 [Roridomyces roridus]
MSLPVSFIAGSRGLSFEEVRFLDYQASYREKRRPPLPCPPYPTDPTVRTSEGLPPLFVPGPLPAAAPNPFLSHSVASIRSKYGSQPSHQLVAVLAHALDDAERTLNFLLQPCTPSPRPPTLPNSYPSISVSARPTPQLFSSTPIGGEGFSTTSPTCFASKASSFFLPTSMLATEANSNSNSNPFGVASSSISSAHTEISSSCNPGPFRPSSSTGPFGSAITGRTTLDPSTAPTTLPSKTASFSLPIFGARPFASPLLQLRSKTNSNPFNIAATSVSSRPSPNPLGVRGSHALPSEASSLGVSSTNTTPVPATPVPRSSIRPHVEPRSVLHERVESGYPPHPHPIPTLAAVSTTDDTTSGTTPFQRLLRGTGTPFANQNTFCLATASNAPVAGQDRQALATDRSAFSLPRPAPGDAGRELFAFGYGGEGGIAPSAPVAKSKSVKKARSYGGKWRGSRAFQKQVRPRVGSGASRRLSVSTMVSAHC